MSEGANLTPLLLQKPKFHSNFKRFVSDTGKV